MKEKIEAEREVDGASLLCGTFCELNFLCVCQNTYLGVREPGRALGLHFAEATDCQCDSHERGLLDGAVGPAEHLLLYRGAALSAARRGRLLAGHSARVW